MIPVAGCLFKPIVGCNMKAGSMNPRAETASEISHHRAPPPEELFVPPSMVNHCSYGDASKRYMTLGVLCFLPFWVLALWVNMQPNSPNSVFSLKLGYRAWHTQLLMCCAMIWRSFSHYNPRALTCCITLLCAIELSLLWRWRPSSIDLLDNVRFQACSLALLWALCSCIASAVNDPGSDASGIALVLVTTGWCAQVGAIKPYMYVNP